MTNLGPLTTAFTPSAGCNSVVYGMVFTQTIVSNVTTTATHMYMSLGLNSTSECYPPGFLPTSVYYSPGICPSDWFSACGTIQTAGSITETRATCCPLGYTCIDTPEPTETWSTLSCSSTAISVVNVTVPDLSNQYSKVTQLDDPVIHAAGIDVRWQRNDFAPETTTGADSPSSSTSPTGIDQASNSESVGFTTADKIGLGIGIGLGIPLLAVALGIFFIRWRKFSKPVPDSVPVDNSKGPKSDARAQTSAPVEIWEQHQPEMFTSSNTHEMQTLGNTHETSGIARPAEVSGIPRAELWSSD